MILEAITVGVIVGSYIYHRLQEPAKKGPNSFQSIPELVEGSAIPMLYGRCRVVSPLLVWHGNNTAGVEIGTIDMHFVIGMPFADGAFLLRGLYLEDQKLALFPTAGISENLTGPYVTLSTPSNSTDGATVFTFIEIGDGHSSQTMVGSLVSSRMAISGVDATMVPGFRGYATFFVGILSRVGFTLPRISFEVSSYPADSFGGLIGEEANPIDVIYDLLTGSGKLELGLDGAGGHLPWSRVSYESFQAAAQTLRTEAHGYSRAIEETRTADENIMEILRQIDAVMYEDQANGLITIKLIRADYDLNVGILDVNVDNCESLEGFAAGGWSGLVNKVRVIYPDRDANYSDQSVTAHNQAIALAGEAEINEVELRYPGVCTRALAAEIAARELSYRSRPLAKCTAIVNRSFLRTNPGDVVTLTWAPYGISDLVFRVAGVNRGELANGAIRLDLIQEAFYTYRKVVYPDDRLPSFGGGGVLIDP